MLVAHAFREMAKTSDIAIQNGGGVRTDIAKGDLTMGDAYKLLPFANTLAVSYTHLTLPTICSV